MGTDLIQEENLIVTSFYGGVNRGKCYQINVRSDKWDRVQLTERQLKKICEATSSLGGGGLSGSI